MGISLFRSASSSQWVCRALPSDGPNSVLMELDVGGRRVFSSRGGWVWKMLAF